jgi:tetratricopeptide (TPR) repeat protein
VRRLLVGWSGIACALAWCVTAGETAVGPKTNPPPARAERAPVSSRDFFNAGTRRLNESKWHEAETLLQAALARQDEGVQSPALYNLGHVRFAQGLEELKKSLAAGPAARRGKVAVASAEQAVGEATVALASGDVQRMVAAYERGRGARKELREATKAVQRALELHGAALRRWQRALGDFQGAAELQPAMTNAPHNARMVERAIARLVDSLRDLQQIQMGMARPQGELEERLKQLKGQIPEPLMPPGADGEEEEDESGRMPEPLPGQKEGPSRDGKEMSLSPEEAGWLLEGFRLDGERRLPMGQDETGQPKDRKGRDW